MVDQQAQVLFSNVHVWDGTADDLAQNTKVLVTGNKIDQVGPSISAPEGATAVDGGGGSLPSALPANQKRGLAWPLSSQ